MLWLNLNCDKTKKTQVVTKIKKLNCDKAQQLKLWQNLITQITTKLKNSNCDQTQKFEMWQNSKTQILLVRTTDEMYSGTHFAISQCLYPLLQV